MSPGPATYRTKSGFDSVNWKKGDVKSPNYMNLKRHSVQLFETTTSVLRRQSNFFQMKIDSGTALNKTQDIADDKGTAVVFNQDMIMKELYTQFIHTVKIEIKDLQKGKDKMVNTR